MLSVTPRFYGANTVVTAEVDCKTVGKIPGQSGNDIRVTS